MDKTSYFATLSEMIADYRSLVNFIERKETRSASAAGHDPSKDDTVEKLATAKQRLGFWEERLDQLKHEKD